MTVEPMVHKSDAIRRDRGAPRGVVALWTLLMIPVLVVLFAVVVEGVHLWLARVELENALEASALAAVKEWAETPSGTAGGWTENARLIGQQYAAANTINKTPVSIDKNIGGYADPGNPNENFSCQGNLIFGAVIEDDPEYVVASYQVPSCAAGAGRVLVEVTSDNLTSGDNGWGISFPTHPDDASAGMLIEKIVIDVDPNGTGNLRFDFTGGGPVLSDNFSQPMVQGWGLDPDTGIEGAAMQHDNYGFVGWTNTTSPTNPTFTPPDGAWPAPTPANPAQIRFSPETGTTTQLTITFHEYDDGTQRDDGFGPGDRFRFGAAVRRGNSAANGDDIGEEGATIKVYFQGILEPVTSFFTDTGYSGNQCANSNNPGVWEREDLGGGVYGNYHLLVHPIRLLTPGSNPLIARDLPCPLTAAANNDKQSIVLALGRGVGVGNHVVRAQATHAVPSLICGFMGIDFGPFTVSAQTTAMYDCELQRPRLIRVEKGNFHCPTSPPP